MFAVQGWNLQTSSLVREQANKPAAASHPNTSSEPKKRKRDRRDVEHSRKIEGSELEKLWNQRFGGNEEEPKKQREPPKKTTKHQDLSRKHARTDTDTKACPATTEDVPIPTQGPVHKSTEKENEHAKDDPKTEVRKGKKAKKQHNITESKHDAEAKSISTSLPPPPPSTTTLTPLQAKMRSKLTSARFRHLNETLYTTPSATSLSLFNTSPELFAEYHAGFSQQVASSWPRNPVDDFIAAIKTRGPLQTLTNPLPRRKTSSCTIADLGCGDAPLARALSALTKKLHLQFHSYDLHAPNSYVTVADVSALPLRDGEADIAVFCLSLMGTNWVDFVEEAWRILRGDGKGEVWVAEVKSRFGRGGGSTKSAGEAVAHSVGKRQKPKAKQQKKKNGSDDEGEDESALPADLFTSNSAAAEADPSTTPHLAPFVSVFARRGFQLKPNSVNTANKMFVSMTFFKSGIPTAGKHKGMKWNGQQYERIGKNTGYDDDDDLSKAEEAKVLKPCVYKTR